MAALADPRGFLSAQEKRTQQMKAMGIEETDINTQGLATGSGENSKKANKDEEKKGKYCSVIELFPLI